MSEQKFLKPRFSTFFTVAGAIIATFFSMTASAAEYLVKSKAEYQKVSDSLHAGDKVILANGVWNDFEILFYGEGTKEQPISLIAEEKGLSLIHI